jgi:hypothetical protein
LQNGYLLTQIGLKYQYGEDPATLWRTPDYYKKLDKAAIEQAARTYLDSKNRVTVTLFYRFADGWSGGTQPPAVVDSTNPGYFSAHELLPGGFGSPV